MTQPPMTPHRVVAERIKAIRKDRGWSAAHLAAELQKVGIRWDRSIVASFEMGRRATVTVEEFLGLAYVLSVAPVHLLVPPDAESFADYQVTPTVTAGATAVRLAVVGRFPLPGMDPWVYFREVPPDERVPDEEMARMAASHRAGMRPITPNDLPGSHGMGGADGER